MKRQSLVVDFGGADAIGPRRNIVRREDGGVRTLRCKRLILTV